MVQRAGAGETGFPLVITILPKIFKLKRINENEKYSSALFSFPFLGVKIRFKLGFGLGFDLGIVLE